MEDRHELVSEDGGEDESGEEDGAEGVSARESSSHVGDGEHDSGGEANEGDEEEGESGPADDDDEGDSDDGSRSCDDEECTHDHNNEDIANHDDEGGESQVPEQEDDDKQDEHEDPKDADIQVEIQKDKEIRPNSANLGDEKIISGETYNTITAEKGLEELPNEVTEVEVPKNIAPSEVSKSQKFSSQHKNLNADDSVEIVNEEYAANHNATMPENLAELIAYQQQNLENQEEVKRLEARSRQLARWRERMARRMTEDELERAREARRLVAKMRRKRLELERHRKEQLDVTREAEQEANERQAMAAEERAQHEFEAQREFRARWMSELKQKHQERQERLQKSLQPARRPKQLLHDRLELEFMIKQSNEDIERQRQLRRLRDNCKQPTMQELENHMKLFANTVHAIPNRPILPARVQVTQDTVDQVQRRVHQADAASKREHRKEHLLAFGRQSARKEYATHVPKVKTPKVRKPLPIEINPPTTARPVGVSRPLGAIRQPAHAAASPRTRALADAAVKASHKDAKDIQEKLKELHRLQQFAPAA